MRVGIDMDGVLADFNGTFIERIVNETGRDLFPARPFDIPCWNYPQTYGYTDAEMEKVWASVHADETFWYDLRPYDDTRAFLEHLDAGWHDLYFITNRIGPNVKMQSEAWLMRHGFGEKTPNYAPATVLISGEKGLCAKALGLNFYIDDRTEYVLDVNHASPTTKVLQLNRSWNSHDYHVVPRLDSLEQFAHLIRPL